MKLIVTAVLLLMAPALHATDPQPATDPQRATEHLQPVTDPQPATEHLQPVTDPQPAMDPPCAAHRVIVGARTQERPIPLMSGDAASGFRPACAVTWNTLSPHNSPLQVSACFRDNLLQIDNATACGGGSKGKLWVPVRWVVTAEASAVQTTPVVACQRLETGVYAATRGLDPTCVPKQ